MAVAVPAAAFLIKKSNSMFITAIFLGLVSSLHCIGMCGPIAMMLPVDRNNPANKTLQILLYHTGRITSYAFLGLIFGTFGRELYLAGMQQQFSIIAGIVMIVIGLVPEKTFAKYNFSKPVYKVLSKIKASLGGQLVKKSYKAFYMTGIFNGLLPCGLVYAALFGALAMQDVTLGVTFMVLYGAGTIPLMSAVLYISGFIKGSARTTLAKIVPFAVVAVGMVFIVRGLGAGIPYLSPSNISLFIGGMPDCK